MDWTDDKVLELIEGYKNRPVLWDRSDPGYKLRDKKYDSWKSLAIAMNTNVDDLKKKMNSLLASFRRERSKERSVEAVGGEEFESTWFAYDAMAFLLDKFHVNDSDAMDPEVLYSEPAHASVDYDYKPSKEAMRRSMIKRKRLRLSRVEHPQHASPPATSTSTSTSRDNAVMNAVIAALQREEDEFDAVGKTVAAKLRRMDDLQRIHAERLINEVLYKGLLGQLEIASDLNSVQE